ncbi:ketoacyl-ACP synthase III [Marinomonas transparens]|uniref:Ketoacyl-ACP synthase III n=1 Tax=Marinomonas transparens TaxID=2795388 RepID=A0A934MYY5_9GAMM|nr:ketoacyl-ACP synthase III [Marinomonas transparens]MBJ7536965.1 ketoacyl-ACP synthase III [Marinomonas transparens]
MPSQIVTSQELMREIKSESNYGIPENWLDEVCGIEERRVATTGDLPSLLAIKAAENALKDSGVQPSEIDVVIFCGISREWIEPSIAHKVQHELGCTNAICFDVSNACHGFMNGILLADNLMQCSDATHVLVVTGEISTDITFHYVDKLKNKKASVKNEIGALTLGDAGAAIILTPKNGTDGFQYYNFYTNAKHANLCKISTNKDGGYDGQMVMGKISSVMVKLHQSLINQTYAALNWHPTDINYFVCHQVGKKPHERMSTMANVPHSIAPISYKKLGNITTATIPINLHNIKYKSGDKILIGGAGSGLTISQTGLTF